MIGNNGNCTIMDWISVQTKNVYAILFTMFKFHVRLWWSRIKKMKLMWCNNCAFGDRPWNLDGNLQFRSTACLAMWRNHQYLIMHWFNRNDVRMNYVFVCMSVFQWLRFSPKCKKIHPVMYYRCYFHVDCHCKGFNYNEFIIFIFFLLLLRFFPSQSKSISSSLTVNTFYIIKTLTSNCSVRIRFLFCIGFCMLLFIYCLSDSFQWNCQLENEKWFAY